MRRDKPMPKPQVRCTERRCPTTQYPNAHIMTFSRVSRLGDVGLTMVAMEMRGE